MKKIPKRYQLLDDTGSLVFQSMWRVRATWQAWRYSRQGHTLTLRIRG